MINLTETISLLELIWVIIGSVGVFMHSTMLANCLIDRRIATRHHANEAELLAASTAVRQQASYDWIQFLMVLLGAMAMVLPNPTPAPTTTQAIVGSLIFIIVEVSLIINGLLDYRDRVKLGQLVKETVNVVV